MELLKLNKTINEQLPLVVSGCMALRGVEISPETVDGVLYKGKHGSHSLDDVLSIVSYSDIVRFIGASHEQKYKSLNGDMVIAMSNYLLRHISIDDDLFREDLEIPDIYAKLNKMFAKHTKLNLPDYLRAITGELDEYHMLTTDNEPMIYLVVNFYLSIHTNQALVFDSAFEGFSDLTAWVKAWRK